MKFSGKVGNWQKNKRLNFGGDPDHHLDTGIIFWELQKGVNGHKSAAHTDLPDGGTGKTCLGGGIHCPSASIMVALWNRETIYIFILFLLSSFFFFFFFLA